MLSCTFFGHRDCPSTIRPKLREALVELIENHGVEQFYVSRQGGFDALAVSLLWELSVYYPHICYAVVLERLPGRGEKFAPWMSGHTVLPEGIETVHPRYAISWRNNWMLAQTDYVVTYVTRPWGGAAQGRAKALHQRKRVIDLAPAY